MGIYLPNMEMPRKGQMLVIFPDGTSYVCFNGMRERLAQTTAIPVPEHGDLIERDKLSKRIKEETINQAEFYADRWHPVVLAYGDCYGKVQNAPTIIPADPPVMYYPQVPGITPTVISDKEEEGYDR